MSMDGTVSFKDFTTNLVKDLDLKDSETEVPGQMIQTTKTRVIENLLELTARHTLDHPWIPDISENFLLRTFKT